MDVKMQETLEMMLENEWEDMPAESTERNTPWSPGGSFIVQKMALTSFIPIF